MPEYDISASLDALLAKPWEDVLSENPKFKTATENWGAERRPELAAHFRTHSEGLFSTRAEECSRAAAAAVSAPRVPAAFYGDLPAFPRGLPSTGVEERCL